MRAYSIDAASSCRWTDRLRKGRPETAIAGPSEVRVGDMVVTQDCCVLQDGSQAVTNLPKGASYESSPLMAIGSRAGSGR